MCNHNENDKKAEPRLLHAWEQSRFLRGSMEKTAGGGAVFTCPKEGMDYRLYSRESDCGFLLEDYKYLCLKLTVLEAHSICFRLSFYEKAANNTCRQSRREAQMQVIFGLLPGVATMVPFDFGILGSQEIFPERTPGRLKMSIFGKPVRLRDIDEIRFQTAPGFVPFHFSLQECFLSDTFPDCTLPHKQLIDGLGQWTQKHWNKKVEGRDDCSRILHSLLKKASGGNGGFPFPDWDEYGGYTKKNFTKTGWFHLERDNGRYWLVNPAGNAFLSSGVDCITPGVETRIGPVRDFLGESMRNRFPEQESDKRHCDFINYGIENLEAAFGENWKECWMKLVKHYLLSWGVNTIGNWSDKEFIRFARMPYVIPLDSFSRKGFPHTDTAIFRDFPDVFSPSYEESARRYAQGLAQYAHDPCLIGYFMRNEPAWAFVYKLNIAEEMLANPAAAVSKDVFTEQMKSKYGTILDFNRAWGVELKDFEELKKGIYKASSFSVQAEMDLRQFSEKMISRYVEIPAKALRKADPNHLNLGMRYAYITDESLLCGAQNFDVFSINCYQLTPLEPVELITSRLEKPVMVGEFHQGALDAGLTAHGICGVTTQEERGCAYRYYVEQGLTNPYFLGAHYFQLNDQSCLGRFDGENYQIGLIDVCMQEYDAMTASMRECHSHMYQVAAGAWEAWERKPEAIRPIHY